MTIGTRRTATILTPAGAITGIGVTGTGGIAGIGAIVATTAITGTTGGIIAATDGEGLKPRFP
jgi:hypothetical protein